jgi:hypothetical protein
MDFGIMSNIDREFVLKNNLFNLQRERVIARFLAQGAKERFLFLAIEWGVFWLKFNHKDGGLLGSFSDTNQGTALYGFVFTKQRFN